MIGRSLSIMCAAYLVAAFPAYGQVGPSYHDSCGGDSCVTDAYDLGYHDGYEGYSYTALPSLVTNPQYESGFSEGEMDAEIEKDARAAEEQAGGKGPNAPRATDKQTASRSDSLLSAALGEEGALTAYDVAADQKLAPPSTLDSSEALDR